MLLFLPLVAPIFFVDFKKRLCLSSPMEARDRYQIYVIFLALFMAGNGFTVCDNWIDCITIIPAMALIGAVVGVLLSGLDYLITRMNKLFLLSKP